MTAYPGANKKKAADTAAGFRKFLATKPKDKPFFFWFGSHYPHRPYPRDIHGAAQGIITFERAGADAPENREMADRILRYALSRLFAAREGRFYYQECRFFRKRFTLMRWCQAWMCYAIAYRLFRRRGAAACSAAAGLSVGSAGGGAPEGAALAAGAGGGVLAGSGRPA